MSYSLQRHIRLALSLSALSMGLCFFQACGRFSSLPSSSLQSGSSASSSVAGPTAGSGSGSDARVSSPEFTTGTRAVGAKTFLDSLGVCIHHAQGVSVASYIAPLQYIGVHNVRDDFSSDGGFVTLHQQTGVKVNMIATTDLSATLTAMRAMAQAGALLSVEGANEANNFAITYNGQAGGGSHSWLPVAQFQRDLYAGVKADPVLSTYPVFADSEAGAQPENYGLQFLKIPGGAGTLMPDGTVYADYANPHNYVSSTQNKYVDNQAWSAADPTLNGPWDGLYVEYGKTWGKGFLGYSNAQLASLPRVTTETGWDSVSNLGGEPVQGTVLLNTFLAQFKRGWSYTFIYMLRDGEGGAGNQGLFHADSTPKLSATYIHNLTSILADANATSAPGLLPYAITNQPATVHDLLLQKSDGTFYLVLWGERVTGADSLSIDLGGNVSQLNIYDPTLGTTAVQRSINQRVLPFSLTDHPIVLELRGISGGT